MFVSRRVSVSWCSHNILILRAEDEPRKSTFLYAFVAFTVLRKKGRKRKGACAREGKIERERDEHGDGGGKRGNRAKK